MSDPIEVTTPDGCLLILGGGWVMGGTVPHPIIAGEWELWWQREGGGLDGAFEPSAELAAARLRRELGIEVAS